jgi:hypothetical protein
MEKLDCADIVCMMISDHPKGEKMKQKKFKRGTVVVFDPTRLTREWWDKQKPEDLLEWYGPLGYGQEKLKFFVFLCEIRNARGHCVLVSLDDQKIITMRHINDFREVTKEEF